MNQKVLKTLEFYKIIDRLVEEADSSLGKEKLKAFEERRKKEGAGVTKKDVARYLNQQKKEAEEPVNNAFAKALAGLNLKDKG